MKGNYKYSTGQLFNFARESYFERTSRPIYAMVFLLPFIVFYEVGTILINTDVLNQSQIRVVAFVWLQNFLEYLGFGSKLAWMMPPLTVVIILVGLQLASHKRWSFGIGDICPMAFECFLLAVPLIVLSLFLNTSVLPQTDVGWLNGGVRPVQAKAAASCPLVAASGLSVTVAAEAEAVESGSLLANIVTGIGAGIYEELIFRLILICLLMLLFQDALRLSRKNSIILAVLVSAALFSVHHHIVYLDGRFGQGSPFNWMEFSFRAVAGVYFAVLFAIRGFGITAGTHAFYDIIATVINSVFFQQ
jgi:membrane protease YdiL (CAAX protease family)